MNRPTLAFDLGTNTGWAATHSNGLLQSGVARLKGGRFEGGGMRFLRFAKVVQELIDIVKPELVAYEEVRRHLGTDAAHVYGGLLATLTSTCEAHKIPYAGIPVQTIKKHATGRGNADKAMMILAAKARWKDQNISDDNHADALWILQTAIDTL